jgi:hypothetical protein
VSKASRRRATEDPLRLLARQEARAVAAGVAETLGLERGRGAVFAEEGEDRSGRGTYRRQLALYRGQLFGHPALVAACDLVCGRELTPREAAGGERDGLKLEAVLLVALDLLAAA